MIRIILMLSIGCLFATLVSFFFQSEFSSDTFNDNSPVISLKELSPKRYSSASTQTTDNSKRNVDIHMKSVERPHINAVFSQIENGNFDNIALFHSLNMECQSTLGFESKEEYMGEYSQQSNMDTYSAESLYDSCSGVNTKKFEEQIEIYREAVEVGESRAEFFLGLTYPPNFKNRIYWLSKSATWKNESIEIISESIHSSSGKRSF